MLLDQGPPVSGQTFMLPWGRGWGFRRTLEQSRGKDALSLLSFTVLELEPVRVRLKIQLEFCIEHNTTLAM